ncbi:MAG: flagellar basal body P-ring protein FlgI [Pirellulaceae bacterium]
MNIAFYLKSRAIWTLCFGLTIGFGCCGCQNLFRKGESPDKVIAEIEKQDGDTRYVGRETSFWGLSFAKIEGVGLISGLSGTGEDPGPSWQRDHLTEELRMLEMEGNVKDLVASKNTSMVRVTALIPPAAQKGDRIDIEVETLKESQTSDITGGYLNFTRLRPVAMLGSRVREGNVMGSAEGFVLVDAVFESRQDVSNKTRGWILDGGVVAETRPVGLTLKGEVQSIRNASSIAQAINSRFTVVTGDGRVGIAKAKTDRDIELLIPVEYRQNVGRLTQVIANMAHAENPTDRINRIALLEKQLADREMSRQASLRLEAIGSDAGPVLKRALKHSDLEVQFHSAVSLAYLGEADGLDVLERCAADEPAFRWHALAALASLSDVRADAALERLVDVKSSEARYGAYHALRKKRPNDPLVRGEVLPGDFMLNVVPSDSDPMIHIARAEKAEVVLFGDDQSVSDDLLFVQSGLTVKGDGNGSVEVVRYLPGSKEIRKKTSTQTSDVVRALALAGCNYSDIVSFFRETKSTNQIDSRLAVNALPKLGRERLGSEWADGNEESERVAEVPAMYGGAKVAEREIKRDDVAQLGGKEMKILPDKKSGSIFGKMTQTFTKNKSNNNE